MITYTCINDLKPFGFHCLTGEACGLSLRLLFDVTAAAKATLVKALGVQDITLLQAWNGHGAIGSVLLSPDVCQTVAVFAMLDAGCLEVWQNDEDKTLIGFETEAEFVEHKPMRRHHRTFRYNGTARDRNRHAFTGRVH